MIDSSDIELIKHILPLRLEKKDSDNISILDKVIFKHNMLTIKCFKTISLSTLSELLGVNSQELLILIEKSYTNGEVEIDQVTNYLYVKEDPLSIQTHIKKVFGQMEEFIANINAWFWHVILDKIYLIKMNISLNFELKQITIPSIIKRCIFVIIEFFQYFSLFFTLKKENSYNSIKETEYY